MICDEDGAEPKREPELKAALFNFNGTTMFRMDWN